jgi:hypothetical protein
MSWLTRAEATGGALKSAPRSKRWEASVCRPCRLLLRRTDSRIEPGCFHQNIFCFGGDHRIPATHHAGQREGLLFIGHHQVFRIEHTLDAIQRPELFAAAGAAQDDAAFQLVAIEGVGGMTHGLGDVVGCVDGIGDELLLQQGEALGDHALSTAGCAPG